jgi:hypothetical protein
MDQSVEQMTERLFQMTLAGLESLNVALGDRLGFYAELDSAPATAEDLATRAGTNPRWTREWLEQQAVMGLLEVELGGVPMRSSTLESYARDAGFSGVHTADVEHDVFRFYVLGTD